MGGDSGVNYIVLQVHYKKVDHFSGELIILVTCQPCQSLKMVTITKVDTWSQKKSQKMSHLYSGQCSQTYLLRMFALKCSHKQIFLKRIDLHEVKKDSCFRRLQKLRPGNFRPQTSDLENSDLETSDLENSDLETSEK